MAKDKSTKKSDSKASGFGKPSEAKGGDSWSFEDEQNVGKLFLISPLREQDFKSDKYGESKVIVAEVVAIDKKNPEKSVEHSEVFIFGGWTKGSLRSFIGQSMVLARLGQDASKSKSDKPAWVLEDPNEKDAELAQAYIDSVKPSFGKVSDSGKKSKGEPEKKAKKSKAEPEPEKKAKGKKKK